MTNPIKQRETRLNSILSSEGFSFAGPRSETRDRGPRPSELLDEEGDPLCTLEEPFLTALDAVARDQVLAVFQQLHSTILIVRERSHKSGIRAGRSEVISSVHELLGINHLQTAISQLETSICEALARR